MYLRVVERATVRHGTLLIGNQKVQVATKRVGLGQMALGDTTVGSTPTGAARSENAPGGWHRNAAASQGR